ncbi:hypothetical protein [Roseivirga echinicomitans]|uniref:Uncharacterized protein n=1 Tax=Roseivirga echinicomitans TaxID=296218 RepID=A0A150XU56_9BACT|nr:hypothetical protein [Roseivirga echinicomitans]KYG82253.1 hypothetical protein AWN68_15540 [Roseivirga echinicomitans]
MKNIYTIILLLSFSSLSFGQLLPGTLDVSGFPNIVESINDLVMEAGEDANTVGFESNIDASLISFTLDPTVAPILGIPLTSSALNCSLNIFRYSVYMHTQNAPQNVEIQAKTTMNSGVRFPVNILYDNLLVRPLGPRDLTPENGGGYITIPNNGNAAIKVFEFVGCRQDIPIQFKVKASALAISGASNFDIFYTVIGSIL